ncbi:MAG: cytochrome c [Acidihalobacter sp.]|jgi:cytochrome c553
MKNKSLIMTAALSFILAVPAVHAAGDPVAGKQKAQMCVACHGKGGHSTNPAYPVLAGQYEDYLLRALKEYKSGARKNPIMTSMVASLTDQDMENLAAYFSSQKALVTPAIEDFSPKNF